MKKSIILILGLLMMGCTTQNILHNNSFKNKYTEFIQADEKIVYSWYHYVITELPNRKYIVRTFYPETKQITIEAICSKPSFKTKNGLAKSWHENGYLQSEGKYVQNKKVDYWKYYHRANGNIASEGKYIIGEKEGLWKSYDAKGRIASEINYIKNIKDGNFMMYDSLGTITNQGEYKGDTIYSQTLFIDSENKEIDDSECMPYLSQCKNISDVEERTKCSNEALLKYVYTNLRYPAKARLYEIEGMTVTQFTIDKTGSIKDINVIIGLCEDLKKENLKVIKNMPKWEPGVKNGKKVDVLYTLPIRYKLEG